MQHKHIIRSDRVLIECDPTRDSVNLKRIIAERVAQDIERKNALKLTASPPGGLPKEPQKTWIELRQH